MVAPPLPRGVRHVGIVSLQVQTSSSHPHASHELIPNVHRSSPLLYYVQRDCPGRGRDVSTLSSTVISHSVLQQTPLHPNCQEYLSFLNTVGGGEYLQRPHEYSDERSLVRTRPTDNIIHI